MNIVLNPTATTGSRTKNRLQARFDKLREALQRQERLNRRFRDELDALVILFQTEISRMDAEQIAPLTSLASRLIEFFSRKSLSHWHREELAEWIAETIGRIHGVESATADRLRERFRQVVAGHMGISEVELDEQLRTFEEAVEGANDTESLDIPFGDDDPQEDLFGHDDIIEELRANDDRFEHEEAFDPDVGDDEEIRSRRLMDGSWARNLFRRAAQVLHPDREPDPEQREAKQRLMQELLEAREQGDILNLLRLYGECVSGEDLLLAEQEMTTACELMENRVDELRLVHVSFIYENPMRMMVHDLFYSPSKRTRENKIRSWKRQLRAEARQTSRLIDELRNLSVLKEVLGERREQKYIDHLNIEIAGLWQ